MIDKSKYYLAKLEEPEFLKISRFVEKNYGIRLPITKRIMVQNRLYKRLIATEIPTFEEYVKYVFSPEGKQEIEAMIDEITTNKTEFFREQPHFDFLTDHVFKYAPVGKVFKIWSGGCSTGEEPYSLAICAETSRVKYNITATDISNKALAAAQKGIYRPEAVAKLPREIVLKFFEKQVIENKTYYAVKKHLKYHIKFSKLNFKDTTYNLPHDFDIIFLRNVLIYFSIDTQNEILNHVVRHLKSDGYLFLGFSETIYNKVLPLQRIGPSIYRKK